MKKTIIGITIFVIFFIVGRFNRDISPRSEVLANPIAQSIEVKSETFFRKALEQRPESKITISDPLESILKNQSGSLLFQYLFEGPFRAPGGLSRYSFQFMRERFSEKLPMNNSVHEKFTEREIADRIGILKALQTRTWGKKDIDSKSMAINLLDELLKSTEQHWLIKRQALRSLVSLNPKLTENQRSERLQKLDSRVIASSAFSDQETIEMMLEKP